jgi:hypothetical protein
VRIYIHRPGTNDIDVLEDAPTDVPLVQVLVDVVEGDFVFIDDNGEPIDLQITLIEIVEVGTRHHHHVHHHPCRSISVSVNYNGRVEDVGATPNATVEAVLTSAISAFGIDPVTGADLVLRVPGSDSDLPGSRHIGSLVPRGTCTATLYLVPGHREQG